MRTIFRWWKGAFALPLLAGCASTDPYKDSLRRFGECGKAVQPMIVTKDAADEALLEAFKMACDEAVKVK